ncbi:alpha/beta fold hydrolase [Brevibacterium otitidis]|uniref:Alpha/beta fold hydrolase n=1 Tax=Brevibacterium otitidis TaxID=53364 RepID=A0ABV5X4N2_9MICO|nr:hypothetical protein GCM10023233_23550 [Brevibacterium otitidis]
MTDSRQYPPALRRMRQVGVATTVTLAMTLGFGSAALAAPSQPADTAPRTAPESTTNPTDLVDKLTITYEGDATLEPAATLEIPVTVKGEAGDVLTLRLKHAQNNEIVPGTDTDVTIGEDGTAEATLTVEDLAPGTYAVTGGDDNLMNSDTTFTVDGDSADGAEETEGAEKEGAEDPNVRPDGLDEYYPELAKELFDADGDGTYEIPGPASGGKSHGNVPKGLEEHYGQAVDMSAENCEKLGLPDYTDRIGRTPECGYVIMPIDAEDPSAGNIAVSVMRVKAGTVEGGKFKENSKPRGTVLWNPGGPGGSGMTLSVAGALFEPDLAAEYDMLGFDPRGTGTSMPFSQCSTDEQIDEDRASNPHGADTREEVEKMLKDQTERFANDCFENTGKAFNLGEDGQEKLMKHLGTWDAVGDMDVMRSVFGDEKLNFIGFSYGTRLGYVYSQKFQANVGRLVLDGVVDPGSIDEQAAMKAINEASKNYMQSDDDPADDEDKTIKQGAGFQNTFEQFAKDCTAKGAQKKTWGELWPDKFGGTPIADETFSCALGDGVEDVDELTKANAMLLQTLEKKPLPTGQPNDNRMVSFADGRTGVFQALYSETMWPELAYGLAELKEGKTAGMLMQLADSYNDRDEKGHYAPMLQAFTNIRCADNNSYGEMPDIEKAREFAERYDEAAPFQASSKTPGEYDYCDFWRFKGTLPAPEKLTKVPNILVVSTTHDSATPYPAGVKLARVIDGTLLSAAGASHTSYMKGDENLTCVDETVNDFLINGNVPEDGDYGKKLDKPDTVKDDRGNDVTLTTQCKVETFRGSGFAISTNKAHTGEKVLYNAEHQDDVDDYTVAFDGETVAKGTTDNGGNASGQFTVPEDAKPGTYEVTFVNAAGDAVATDFLEVMRDDDPKENEDDDDANGGGDTDEGGKDDDKGGKDNGKDDNADDRGPLPRTGAEIMPYLLLILALIGGGAAALYKSRRTSTEG